MCPTVIGRLQSRVLSLPLPLVCAVLLALATDRASWVLMIGVLLAMGVVLDVVVYPRLISYQPPWLTGVVGLSELGFLFVLLHVLDVRLNPVAAIGFYVVAWSLATATRIVAFPILSLTYLESAGQFRRVGWSVPEAHRHVPVLAAAPEGGELGELLLTATRLPPPNGVREPQRST